MVKIKRYANVIERFLQGEKGQRFFNIAYSVGAAIVIWGALFKILHLPGGNLLLCIGMGTEIFMFILTAFDRPPKEVDWEEVLPVLKENNYTSNELQLSGAAALPVSFMEEASIQRLNDTSEQFVSAIDNVSRQMSELNRHLSAINSIYELQLRDVSYQLQNMDGVSKQLEEIKNLYERSSQESLKYKMEAEKMTANMRELNAVYERIIKAMVPDTNK